MKFRLVLTLVITLVVTACSAERTESGGEQGYPEVTKNLTQIPPGERELVPEVSGPELGGGKSLSSKGYPGRIVVVNVWGSWCPPCRKEAPALQAASVETAATAQFLGVNIRDLDPAAPEAFVRANKITYPSIYDPSGRSLLAFAGDLPPSAIPSTLILDSEGRLAVRILGEISTITLVTMINDVAAGR